MHVGDFLEQSALVLGAAVLVLVVSGRLRLPSVVGLLVTGMAIGPSALGWMGREEVEVLAEIGVVLLLFTIGLEQSLGKLRELLRPFLLGGAIQTLGTIVAVAGLASLLSRPLPEAIFLGFLASLSSTAIVLRLYEDRRETATPHGRVVLAILLFQDFMVVPMLALTPCSRAPRRSPPPTSWSASAAPRPRWRRSSRPRSSWSPASCAWPRARGCGRSSCWRPWGSASASPG